MKVFVASSERFAGCIVDALLRHGHEVVGVASPQKGIYDRQHFGPRFWPYLLRGWDMLPLTRKKGVPLRVVSSLLDGSLVTFLRQKKPDLLLVFGWPSLIGEKILSLFPLGGMNVHPSLLPKLRGPDPLFHIIDQEAQGYGLSFHRIVEELDGGPVYHQVKLNLDRKATYDRLYCQVLESLAENVPKALDSLQKEPGGREQKGEVTQVARFLTGHRILDPLNAAEAEERRTRACYSHHVRFTAQQDRLLSFTGLKLTPYKDLAFPEPGSIQAVGLTRLDVNIAGQYASLTGVRVCGKLAGLTPLWLALHCKPGSLLANKAAAKELAKHQGLL